MSDDPLDRVLSYAATPAETAWRKISDRVLQARGPQTYTAPLVPGFDELEAEEFLMLPTRDQYEEQVAAGEVPRYVQESEALQRKGNLAKAKRLATQLAKLSYDISWEFAEEPYLSDTAPEDRDFSRKKERHVSTGVDIAWEGNREQAPGSEMEEPARINPILKGGPQ